MLFAARTEARSKFDIHRGLPLDSLEVKQKIVEAEEVGRILRQNVVQGEHVTGSGTDNQQYRASFPLTGSNASIENFSTPRLDYVGRSC